jgi:hypothetical protein
MRLITQYVEKTDTAVYMGLGNNALNNIWAMIQKEYW